LVLEKSEKMMEEDSGDYEEDLGNFEALKELEDVLV